jgi:hypothetical protein
VKRQKLEWPTKVAPAYPGDEDWEYPPEIKELISILAKQVAIELLAKEIPIECEDGRFRGNGKKNAK